MRMSKEQKSLMYEALRERATKLRRIAAMCAGDLYRSIYTMEANEIDEVIESQNGAKALRLAKKCKAVKS